jgi:hypothetical protein
MNEMSIHDEVSPVASAAAELRPAMTFEYDG